MNYLYHRIPDDFQGNILYPLNVLKDTIPDIYTRHISKYEGRTHIIEQRILLFDNCLWNDVVFLSAVEPTQLFEARRRAGWPDRPPQKFFKIDPRSLDQSKLGIFLYRPDVDNRSHTEGDFATYNYVDLERYTQIPAATKEYFKREYDRDAPYIKLFWRYIPHILYHGEIDVADAEIILAN
jgi:hypothetical protein